MATKETNLQTLALDKFFDFYRGDIDAEVIDSSSVALSFPVHFSGFHRIEVTITNKSPDLFIISDGGRTISELKIAGYAITSKFRQRLEFVTRAAQIRVVNDYLIAETNLSNLGSSIQRFVEASKTIGDAYLVQRMNASRATDLIERVSSFLAEQPIPYKRRYHLQGGVERHLVDFYFPPNGVPGLALSIMNNPGRTNAEALAYRANDIRKADERTRVGVVYDDEQVTDNSKKILAHDLDLAVPGSNIPDLKAGLLQMGILH